MDQHKQTCHTLSSSPSHHHSSDFQFTVSLSPPKSAATNLRPADELFYDGQLLPLNLSLSPRNSMVHNLLTTTIRHSDYNSSFSSSDSSRPSSATQDDNHGFKTRTFISDQEKKVPATGNQFSLNRFPSVSHKPAAATTMTDPAPATRVTGSSMKEKIRNYVKKLSKFRRQKTTTPLMKRDDVISYSFSGNLRFLTRTSCVSSCPSTMPSSPSPTGALCRKTIVGDYRNSLSATEELQSAIQGAIAHCKNSMSR